MQEVRLGVDSIPKGVGLILGERGYQDQLKDSLYDPELEELQRGIQENLVRKLNG